MHRWRYVAVAALSIALVGSSVTVALARPHRGERGPRAPYRISTPRVASYKVAIGAAFDATGVVTPPIAADDASTTVSVSVYRLGKHGRLTPSASFGASLDHAVAEATGYSAPVTLPAAGEYVLVAVVTRDGVVLGRSKPRPVRAVLPYRVSKPHVASPKATMGIAFEATGVVTPSIAPDDASTIVSILAYGVGKHGKLSEAVAFAAALTGPVDEATGYSASVTLPSAGEYMLVAVVTRDGVVLGRSAPRPVRAVLPYRVSKPRVASHTAAIGVAFEATGVVTPSIAADDASTTVSVLVYAVGRHGRLTEAGTFTAALTGPVDEATGYSASVTLDAAGKYVLVAVVTRDGVVLGRSAPRAVRVPRAVTTAAKRSR